MNRNARLSGETFPLTVETVDLFFNIFFAYFIKVLFGLIN